jgi:catechol 2,3-dioxygenase
MSIWRVGYVEVRSLNLDRDVQFWRDVVGLVETARDNGKVYFKCCDLSNWNHTPCIGENRG